MIKYNQEKIKNRLELKQQNIINSGSYRGKWIQRIKFKSSTFLAFHFALMPLENVWIHYFILNYDSQRYHLRGGFFVLLVKI